VPDSSAQKSVMNASNIQRAIQARTVRLLGPDSPRLPAGYVVLMFASMVPRVWRRMMRTAYSHWLEHPRDPRSPGRKLTCFGLRKFLTRLGKIVAGSGGARASLEPLRQLT
jgi:hypothetical protein